MLCKRRGILYFAEGLFKHYRPIMLRGDDVLVSVLLQSQVPSNFASTEFSEVRRKQEGS